MVKEPTNDVKYVNNNNNGKVDRGTNNTMKELYYHISELIWYNAT